MSAAAANKATDGIVVVKLGGTTIADQRQVLDEVVRIAKTRPIVLVHGGGKRISTWLEKLGVESRWEGGLRVTDAPALEVVEAVLRGVVNSELVAGLRALGADAVGLSGADGGLLPAERVPGLGLVGHITSVRREILDRLFEGGFVPVIAPMGIADDGQILNVNGDDAAAGLAAGLRASRLILMTDVDGIRGADGATLSTITADEAERLIADGVISGGMVPKVRSALASLVAPGAVAVIANGGAPDALARAIDDPAFGTRISAHAAAAASTPAAASTTASTTEGAR